MLRNALNLRADSLGLVVHRDLDPELCAGLVFAQRLANPG